MEGEFYKTVNSDMLGSGLKNISHEINHAPGFITDHSASQTTHLFSETTIE